MPSATIPRGDVVALTRALVRVDSRNPSLCPDAPGEASCARLLADVLLDWGFDVQLVGPPDRPNVVARTQFGEGLGQLRDHLVVESVAHLGAVQGDGGHKGLNVDQQVFHSQYLLATSSSITSVAPPPIASTRASRHRRSTGVSRM